MNDNWAWQNPSPQGNTIWDMQFINDNVGYACGNFGTVIKTTDGGVTWDQFNAPTTKNLFTVFFFNSNTGYVAGSGGYLAKTDNGGLTWAVVNFPTNDFLKKVLFTDQNTGYVLSSFSTSTHVYKTTDAGATWNNQGNGGALFLDDMYFLNQDTGFACGGSLSGYIIKTTNGGNTWSLVSDAQFQAIYAIKFLNDNTGYAAGDDGGIYKSVDAGLNWTQVGSPSSSELNDIYFRNDTVIVAGVGTILLKSTNQGSSWDVTYSGFSIIYQTFTVTDGGTYHRAGQYGRMTRSTNGGANWIDQPDITNATLWDVDFIDANTGVAVGSWQSNIMVRTTNGGTNWSAVDPGVGISLFSVDFADNNIGYACGTIGNMVKTTDAGATWSVLNVAGTDDILRSIDFVNANTGYALGDYGMIFKTTNGGSNWTAMQSDANDGSALFFTSEETGFLTSGSFGETFKTTNGGVNWTALNNNLNGAIWSISFVNSDTGYMAGSGIERTTDGGATWHLLNTPSSSYRSVVFKENFGYAVGNSGLIIKSTDYGNNWITQPTVTNNGLMAVDFTDSYNVYAVGLVGTIISTIPQELVPTGVDPVVHNTPDNFSLKQNYPNPFNPSTKIQFAIPKNGFVTLKVYDMLGREVSTLVSRQLTMGTYNFDFNGANLTSGVYFYRLDVQGQFSETKKMLLVK